MVARLALLLVLLTSCGAPAGPVQVGQSRVPGDMQTWNRTFSPYRVIDNIYYVGTNKLAQFLITTPDGNLLLDTGFEEGVPRLRENIEALGFRYADIKLILTSHAHIDHVQAHALVRRETGARVVASAADAAFIESGGKGEPVFDGIHSWPPCSVDQRIADGEKLQLGGTELVAHLTPGHTVGATTWTMTVHDRGKALSVVFFPSANVNPGVHLIGNQRYPNIARDFEHSFATWKALSCDVFLACHGDFYEMSYKVGRMREASTNPFIDPQGYRHYLAAAEQRFRDQLQSER